METFLHAYTKSQAAGVNLSMEFPPFVHSDAILSSYRSSEYGKDIGWAIELAYCVTKEH